MRAGSRRTSPAGARSRSNTSGAAGGCTGVSVSRSTREGLRRRALLDELISTPVEHELTRLTEGTDDPHDAALGLLDRLEAHRAEVVDLLGEILSGAGRHLAQDEVQAVGANALEGDREDRGVDRALHEVTDAVVQQRDFREHEP